MKTIKDIIFEEFHNVLYIGKTGSETMVSESRNRDIDVFVIVKELGKKKDKMVIERDGYKLDIFVRDLNYYNSLIEFEDLSDRQAITLVYNPFHEILFDLGVKKFNYKKYYYNLETLIIDSMLERGCNPDTRATVAFAKGFNMVYLLKLLRDGIETLSELDKENLSKIYNKDRDYINSVLAEFNLWIPDQITRLL